MTVGGKQIRALDGLRKSPYTLTTASALLPSDDEEAFAALRRMHKAALLLTRLGVEMDAQAWLFDVGVRNGLLDPLTLPIASQTIGPGTWEAALASAETATTAAGLVLAGAGETYALCRPPGHHAYADMAGGFCFLNNTAIAAQHLRRQHARVAVLDVDVHHGNGTQGIFFECDDVLTVSIHADPSLYYPYFWGHAHETGAGKGHGYNLNLPLPLGSPDRPWLDAGDKALARIREFAPTALVVALGLDASESDPLQGLKVTGAGFYAMAENIARLGLPTVLAQEGGYLSHDLGRNLAQFLAGFEKGRG